MIGQEKIHKRFWLLISNDLTKNAFNGLFGDLGVFQNDCLLKKEIDISRFKMKNPNWTWPSPNAWPLIVFSAIQLVLQLEIG